jgi:nucleotide-binding universal stress UspA family protein
MLSKLFGSRRDTAAPIAERKADGLVPNWRRIALPATGAPFSIRAIENTARLAAHCPGCIVELIYVIEVPRAYALQSPLPDEDVQAQTVLENGLQEARRFNLDVSTEVLRVRDITDGLAKHVVQQGIDLMMLGCRPDEVRGLPRELIRDIVDKMPCEVIVDFISLER